MAKFEIYQDAIGDYRWRFLASNGNILAESGQGFNNRANCEHSIILLKQQVSNALISEEIKSGASATTER